MILKMNNLNFTTYAHINFRTFIHNPTIGMEDYSVFQGRRNKIVYKFIYKYIQT